VRGSGRWRRSLEGRPDARWWWEGDGCALCVCVCVCEREREREKWVASSTHFKISYFLIFFSLKILINFLNFFKGWWRAELSCTTCLAQYLPRCEWATCPLFDVGVNTWLLCHMSFNHVTHCIIFYINLKYFIYIYILYL